MSNKLEHKAMTKEPGLVPKLRFPEFRKMQEWDTKPLNNLAQLIHEKAGSKSYTLLSITAGVGLVTQIEKFGREIAGDSYKNYLVIEKGDFAYNKSSTKQHPEGQIALLEKNDRGAVPNSIFTCFRVDKKAISPYFLKYPFASNIHGNWLRNFIAVGARANGALQVDSKDLLSLPINYPSLKEQQKIADCLSSLDELITLEAQKLEVLKSHKKGLMQQLFPAEGETRPKLRFPEFWSAEEWQYQILDPYLVAFSERVSSNTKLPIYSSTRTGLKAQKDYFDDRELENNGEYGVVPEGYFVYRHMSDDGTFKFNINKTGGSIAVSKEYPVFTTVDLYSEFLLYLLNGGPGFKEFALAQKKGGTRTRLYLKVLRSWEALIPSYSEQKKIAACLSTIDNHIGAQSQKIEHLKSHKKGLMQQLFPVLDGAKI